MTHIAKLAEPEQTVSVLVLPDIHVPEHDVRSIAAVLKYARGQRWDMCIQLGDFLDLSSLSRFSQGKAADLNGEDVFEDFRVGRELIADIKSATRAVNPDCRFVLLEGNHEARVHKFCAEMPQLHSLLSVPRNLELDERDLWVPADSKGAVLRVDYGRDGIDLCLYGPQDKIKTDGVAYIHGWFVNVHHAKKTLERFGHGPIFYGHTHDVNLYACHQYGASTPEGGSLGHLAMPQDYLHGRPTNWQQAFGVFHFSDIGYTSTAVKINEHKFVGPDGVLYGDSDSSRSKADQAIHTPAPKQLIRRPRSAQ